jgi:hypothetical protein
LTTYEGNSGKNGAMKNLFPMNRKPERAVQAKMGLKNDRMKNDMKSIDHRCEHPMFTQHWHA